MYNTDLPRRADLPTSGQLARSTIIAAAAAAAILVTIVLPSEYAIDPTGVGRMLGLTEMGEIKTQLAAEAATDAAATASAAPVRPTAPGPGVEGAPLPETDQALAQRLDQIETLLARQQEQLASLPAAEQPPPPSVRVVEAAPPEPSVVEQAATALGRSDEVSFTLTPGQGAEIKLVMQQGARADFSWTSTGIVNVDTHGDGGGRSVSYEKGRGIDANAGMIEAAFDGNHGWFWRNRGNGDVTVTLRTSGDYAEIKRMM